jgi:hypothetical protein
LTNAGKLDIGPGSTLGVPTATFVQSGGTTTVSGTLEFANGATINGGVLNGNGDIRSSVVNTAGTLAPGDSLGALRIFGDYTQGSADYTPQSLSRPKKFF